MLKGCVRAYRCFFCGRILRVGEKGACYDCHSGYLERAEHRLDWQEGEIRDHARKTAKPIDERPAWLQRLMRQALRSRYD